VREDRIELLCVEVMIDHLVTGGLKLLDRRLGNRVTETPLALMTDDDQDLHGGNPPERQNTE